MRGEGEPGLPFGIGRRFSLLTQEGAGRDGETPIWLRDLLRAGKDGYHIYVFIVRFWQWETQACVLPARPFHTHKS